MLHKKHSRVIIENLKGFGVDWRENASNVNVNAKSNSLDKSSNMFMSSLHLFTYQKEDDYHSAFPICRSLSTEGSLSKQRLTVLYLRAQCCVRRYCLVHAHKFTRSIFTVIKTKTRTKSTLDFSSLFAI